ncbi:hypothetical protein [Sanguibacter sp. 25GB23B1]|uniref:hypothetical protein n=1 Tax=unclassified Sanguibacter TaxID=2645534 RepID=UPI0032AF836D
MRDEASPTARPPADLPPAVLPPTAPAQALLPPVELRPSLLLRVGATVLLAALLVVLVVTVVGPSVAGRPDAPGPVPSTVAVVLSIAAVVLLAGCWRVRLSATSADVTRVGLFSDAQTITLDDARRIEVSTALAEDPPEPAEATDAGPVGIPGASSILPTIVLTGRGDMTITSRENRREADTILPTLLVWSRQRPELVKDAHTLRFLTAYGRANP